MTSSKNTNGLPTPHRTVGAIREQLADLQILKAQATANGTPDFASQLGMQSILNQERQLNAELQAAIESEYHDNADASPLLSEFSRWPRFVGFLQKPTLRIRLAFIALLLGLLLAALSVLSGAHAIRATINGPEVGQDIKKDGQVIGIIKPAEIWYGYCVELNHGLFGITLAPLLLFLCVFLLQETSSAIRSLVSRNRLVSASNSPNEVNNKLSKWNRWASGYPMMLLVPLIFIFVIGSEWWTREAPILGWFQADIARTLDGKPVTYLEHYKTLIELPDVKKLYEDDPDEQKRFTNIQKMIINVHGGVESNSQHYLFFCLFFLTLTWHAVLIALGTWLVLKAGFVCVLLWWASPLEEGRAKTAIYLQPDLKDSGKRYGMNCMDKFYDLVLAAALTCSVDFFLSYLSNGSKGTILLPSWDWVFLGEAFLLILPVLGIMLIVFVPVILMGTHLASLREGKLHQLESEQAKNSNNPDDMDRYGKEIENVRSQRPYPTDDFWFFRLLMLHVAFIFLGPLGITALGADKVVDIGKALRDFVILFCPCKP